MFSTIPKSELYSAMMIYYIPKSEQCISMMQGNILKHIYWFMLKLMYTFANKGYYI